MTPTSVSTKSSVNQLPSAVSPWRGGKETQWYARYQEPIQGENHTLQSSTLDQMLQGRSNCAHDHSFIHSFIYLLACSAVPKISTMHIYLSVTGLLLVIEISKVCLDKLNLCAASGSEHATCCAGWLHLKTSVEADIDWLQLKQVQHAHHSQKTIVVVHPWKQTDGPQPSQMTLPAATSEFASHAYPAG